MDCYHDSCDQDDQWTGSQTPIEDVHVLLLPHYLGHLSCGDCTALVNIAEDHLIPHSLSPSSSPTPVLIYLKEPQE